MLHINTTGAAASAAAPAVSVTMATVARNCAISESCSGVNDSINLSLV